MPVTHLSSVALLSSNQTDKRDSLLGILQGTCAVILLGPKGFKRWTCQVPLFFYASLAGSDVLLILPFNYPSHCLTWCDELQAPLFLKIREIFRGKVTGMESGHRVPGALCCLPWLQSWTLRPLTNENQIVSKIHLSLLGLSAAI